MAECDFIDDAPGHLGCMLPVGHEGRHRGSDLTCGPLMCDHVIPQLDVDGHQWLLARLDALELTDAVTDLEPEVRPVRLPGDYRQEIDRIASDGMFQEALSVSFYVQRVYPEDAHLARQYADLMTKGGLFTDALDVWEALIRVDHLYEMQARDLAGKARCYNGRNQHHQALECADLALEISPDGYAVSLAHYERADALYRLDRIDEAFAALDACDATLPNADEDLDPVQTKRRSQFTRCACVIELARSASRTGEPEGRVKAAWERALAEADRWLLDDPDLPLVQRPRAEVLRRLDRYEECLAALDLYEARRPPDQETVYWRTNALVQLDRPQESLAITESWLRAHPDAEQVIWSHIESMVDLQMRAQAFAALRMYERSFGQDGWSEAIRDQLRSS